MCGAGRPDHRRHHVGIPDLSRPSYQYVTVGNVQIKLDEAKANTDGSLVPNAARVKENSYKLIPGHTYNKDPMVTVLSGSESSYIKMTVTPTPVRLTVTAVAVPEVKVTAPL